MMLGLREWNSLLRELEPIGEWAHWVCVRALVLVVVFYWKSCHWCIADVALYQLELLYAKIHLYECFLRKLFNANMLSSMQSILFSANMLLELLNAKLTSLEVFCENPAI